MKALEIVSLMRDRSGKLIEAAGKVASRYGRTVLEEKIMELAERRLMGLLDGDQKSNLGGRPFLERSSRPFQPQRAEYITPAPSRALSSPFRTHRSYKPHTSRAPDSLPSSSTQPSASLSKTSATAPSFPAYAPNFCKRPFSVLWGYTRPQTKQNMDRRFPVPGTNPELGSHASAWDSMQGGRAEVGLQNVAANRLWNGRDVSSDGLGETETTVNGTSLQHGSIIPESSVFADHRGLCANKNCALLDDGLSSISAGPQEANATADGLATYDFDIAGGAGLQQGIYGLPIIGQNSLSYDSSLAPFSNHWEGSLNFPVPVPTNSFSIVSPGIPSVSGSLDVSLASPATDTPSASPAATVTSPAASGRFPCLHPGCVRSFGRSSDLKRHVDKHNTGPRPFNCNVDGCKYNGAKGFYRRDKLIDHQRKIHGMHMPVPVPSMNAGGY
ncbi:MAG: hypothetical protein Q9187_009039 [Circinaria calcarea]